MSRMRVILTTHGGEDEALKVMNDGLVVRNMRAIREGRVPLDPRSLVSSGRIGHAHEPVWRDAVDALRRTNVSSRSLAAWECAARRLAGDPTARLVMDSGHVAVASVDGLTTVGDMCGTCNAGQGLVGAIPGRSDEGKIVEFLTLAIDDEQALPVREFGDAIAEHNARRIVLKGLPGIYDSGVRYEVEGTPELWWDAEEILAHGHDDCEGLAAYRAGELLVQGIDARVWTRQIPKPKSAGGGRLFHAVTRIFLPDGRVVTDDPSVRLGMPCPAWYLDYASKRRAKGLDL